MYNKSVHKNSTYTYCQQFLLSIQYFYLFLKAQNQRRLMDCRVIHNSVHVNFYTVQSTVYRGRERVGNRQIYCTVHIRFGMLL